MKALFIDEDLEVEVLVNALQDRHHQDSIRLADNLGIACQMLWSEKFDVVVVDIMMPADNDAVPGSEDESGLLSGLLLITLVQKSKDCPNQKTRFIILTGLIPDEHEMVEQAQKKYDTRFLVKPVHPDTMYEVMLDAIK